VELDPKFAMAYGVLGTAYTNLGDEDRGIENIQKAYDLRAHASEREKFRIASYYYLIVTGELEKAKENCQEWALTYPRDWLAHGLLANALASVGRYERAVQEDNEALRLNPDAMLVYSNLIEYQLALGRLDEAEAMLREAERRNTDPEWIHFSRYLFAFLRGDAVEMQRHVDWSGSNPEAGASLVVLQAHAEAFSGHLGRARGLIGRRVEQAQSAGRLQPVTRLQIVEAQWEVEFGNAQRARQQIAAVLPQISAKRVQLAAALTLARAGDAARAQAVSEKFGKRFPRHALIHGYWLPAINAAIEINRQNPGRAIELLKAAIPYELADPEVGSPLYPAYLRGEAYLLSHQGGEAAAEFQKFVDHRGLVGVNPLGALARLGLARAYALQGNAEKARVSYQDFFALWKDADPDIPIFREAKAEFARLK
jgi:tetratricopeptide (TPR) repeat protein